MRVAPFETTKHGDTYNSQRGDTMAEDTATVTDDDIADVSLIDTPLDAPASETPQTSDETAETKGTETAETTDKPETISEAKDTEATATGETPEQNTEETTVEKGKPDPALAYKAYQERKQTRDAIAGKLDATYGPKTEEQLIEEGLDPRDAQIQALREEMQYQSQRGQIAELNAGMQAEAVNVVHDYPVFDPDSKEFDPDFTKMVEQQYQTAARLQTDENGIILNAEVPLYDFYKSMADIYSRGATKGSEKGQADAMQMLSRTEDIGGSSSTSKGGNSLDELEERLGDMVIT